MEELLHNNKDASKKAIPNVAAKIKESRAKPLNKLGKVMVHPSPVKTRSQRAKEVLSCL